MGGPEKKILVRSDIVTISVSKDLPNPYLGTLSPPPPPPPPPPHTHTHNLSQRKAGQILKKKKYFLLIILLSFVIPIVLAPLPCRLSQLDFITEQFGILLHASLYVNVIWLAILYINMYLYTYMCSWAIWLIALINYLSLYLINTQAKQT